MLREWLSQFDPEDMRRMVYLGQAILGGVFVAALFYMRSRPNPLRFRVFEADLQRKAKPQSKFGRPEVSHSAQKPKVPLLLSGVVTTGAPHEILGISSRANAAEIQKAFRELMKRYHPDKVGPAGSREWKDAQRIAEAIIRAKEEMLKAGHASGSPQGKDPAKDPNRSGR